MFLLFCLCSETFMLHLDPGGLGVHPVLLLTARRRGNTNNNIHTMIMIISMIIIMISTSNNNDNHNNNDSSEKGEVLLRPISVLTLLISEGLTQAQS